MSKIPIGAHRDKRYFTLKVILIILVAGLTMLALYVPDPHIEEFSVAYVQECNRKTCKVVMANGVRKSVSQGTKEGDVLSRECGETLIGTTRCTKFE